MAIRRLLFLFLAAAIRAPAQTPVSNDNLADRLPLYIGESRDSRTDGCTVQWSCVSEALTGQKIDYHNDQWFSFRPSRAGQYFLNVSGQRCREVRGVQLIALIAAELCNPSTYSILSATSLGTQDDIFVPLTAAVAGQEILLCVDGYLHDYCRFRIAVDTVARGLPVGSAAAASVPGVPPRTVASRAIELHWALPDSLTDATSFVVYRRAPAAPRAVVVAEVPVLRNAAAGVQRAYHTTDTLPAPGRYHYQIVTAGTPVPMVVWQETAEFQPAPLRPVNGRLAVPLDGFRPGAVVRVIVTDADTKRELQKLELVRAVGGPPLVLPVAALVRRGIRRLRITLTAAGTAMSEVIEAEI